MTGNTRDNATSRKRKTKTAGSIATVTLGVVACAACCAPLLLPLFAGIGGAGIAGAAASGMLGVSWGEIACAAILAALAASALFLVLRSRPQRKTVSTGCSCDPSQTACAQQAGCSSIPRTSI